MTSFPASDATDVPVNTGIAVQFSRPVMRSSYANSLDSTGPEFPICANNADPCFCVKANIANAACIEGTVEVVGDAQGVEVVQFRPKRRLKYGTEYTVDVQNIQDGTETGDSIQDANENIRFTTFQPSVIGSTKLERPIGGVLIKNPIPPEIAKSVPRKPTSYVCPSIVRRGFARALQASGVAGQGRASPRPETGGPQPWTPRTS